MDQLFLLLRFLSKKRINTFFIRISRITLFIVFFLFCGGALQSQTPTDSLEVELNNAATSLEKIEILNTLVETLNEIDLQKSLTYAQQGRNLAEADNMQEWTASFDVQLADIYGMMSKYDSTHYCLDAAITYYQTVEQTKEIANLIRKKGLIYQNQGMFEKAFESHMEALALFETIGDQAGIANTFVRLSDVFFYLERPKEGADYGEKAIKIYRDLGDEEGLANAYQYTGDNYLLGEDYENAFQMMNQALVIKKRLNASPLSIGSLLNARGNVLKYLKRFDESLADYTESYKIVKKVNHVGGLSATLANIGDVYIRMGKYEEALPKVLESSKMQEENGFISNLMENFGHLTTIYKKLGDFEKALHYHEKYVTIRDSIVSLEKVQATSELQTKYETAKKETLITAQEQELFRNKIIQWVGVGFLVLLGVILFLLYRSFQLKQKSNKLLEAANKQLEQKNVENELLLKEIHHRVKNNLQTISSLLNLQSANIDDSAALEAVTESQNRVRSMALIHQKLYQGENLAAVEMKDYFETMGEAMIESFGKQNSQIGLKVEMDQMELDVDTAIPIGLIVNELLTNSLKYAFPNNREGKIALSLTKEKDHVFCLRTSDNGVGMTGEKDKTMGAGTGFGGKLVQLLTMQLGGKMEMQGGEGTTTVIRFSPAIKTA